MAGWTEGGLAMVHGRYVVKVGKMHLRRLLDNQIAAR